MYCVEWNDWEGNYHFLEDEECEAIRLEAEALQEKYNYVNWGLVEYLYSVGLRDIIDDSRFNLRVWAKDTDAATRKLCGRLIGPRTEYAWLGTAPVYENNQRIARISPA